MSSYRNTQVLLFVDPSLTLSTLPPGHDAPGFERAFAEARMFVNVAYAGASKRVLHRLARSLGPQSRTIAHWMVRELRAARLVPVACVTTSLSSSQRGSDHD